MINGFPFIFANRRGIPMLETNSVSVTSTNVVYNITAHTSYVQSYTGLILFKIAQPIPSGTTTTLPVQLASETTTAKTATTATGADITAADIAGTGIVLAFYDNASGTLTFLTGLTA